MNDTTDPRFDGVRPEAQFRAFLAAGDFRLQRCKNCGKHVYYPRSVCPSCQTAEFDWVSCSGRGEVYAVTVVSRKSDRGGDYNVALIDLEEGVRVLSRVDDIAPADITIGMPVKVAIEQYQDQPILVFSPC